MNPIDLLTYENISAYFTGCAQKAEPTGYSGRHDRCPIHHALVANGFPDNDLHVWADVIQFIDPDDEDLDALPIQLPTPPNITRFINLIDSTVAYGDPVPPYVAFNCLAGAFKEAGK